MLTRCSVRPLGPAERDAALMVLGRDRVANTVLTARVLESGLEPRRLDGELWGWFRGGELEALCFAGATLMPAQAGAAAVRAFAERARRASRPCASITGPETVVGGLWNLLEPYWGPARVVRTRQPLMATDRAPAVPPDPEVRPARGDETGRVVPACVAMFTEEVGVSPLAAADGGRAYRARVAATVSAGRCFARFENGRVVFKAEIGAVTPHTCQLQGVWTAPDRRGRGLATAGLAAVVRHALTRTAPVVTLYVNDFNTAALATYRRLGFVETGALRTVFL